MLDVHAPHEKIHGISDFLLHLLTITIGLLIALSLEGCVEWNHHRHLRNEANENLRHEIEENRKEVESVVKATNSQQKELGVVMRLLAARAEKREIDIKELSLTYHMATLKDASWQTASATGALSYMDYGRVENFASSYTVQKQFSALQDQTLSEFLNLQSYMVSDEDPTKMPADTAKAALTNLRLTVARVYAIKQVGTALEKQYDETLKATQ